MPSGADTRTDAYRRCRQKQFQEARHTPGLKTRFVCIPITNKITYVQVFNYAAITYGYTEMGPTTLYTV